MKDSWVELTLDDVCSKITDGSHHSPKSVNVGKPMGSVKDMTPFGLNLKTSRLISNGDFDKLVKQGCKPAVNDVLISKDGNSALDTVCRIRKPINAVLLSSVAILRPDTEVIEPEFLRLYLDAEPTRQYLKATSISGAAIPRVILKDFKRAKIRLPSCLNHQKLISNYISNYDNLIENNNRRIAILEDMAQSLYREWFVNFRYPGHADAVDKDGNQKLIDSPLGQIPEGWGVMRLDEIADVNPESITKKNTPESIGYIDIKSVGAGIINEVKPMLFKDAPSRARRIVIDEDIIWATVRPNRKQFSYICKPNTNTIASTGFAVLRSKNVPSSYLYSFTTTESFTSYLVNHATGSAYPAVNADIFQKANVLLPPIKLLEDFDELSLATMRQSEALKKKNKNLKQQRDMLLPKLISGQIELKD